MLARIPTARRTLDADLYRTGYNKDQALSDLRRLAAVDLGDHFWFVYREHHAILAGDAQPYADGYRVTFDAYLGAKLVSTIKIDLSAGTGPTDSVELEEPANRLQGDPVGVSPTRTGGPRPVRRPTRLGSGLHRLSVNTPAEPHSISAARRIMQAPIDPVLAGEVRGVWDPRDQDWSVT